MKHVNIFNRFNFHWRHVADLEPFRRPAHDALVLRLRAHREELKGLQTSRARTTKTGDGQD